MGSSRGAVWSVVVVVILFSGATEGIGVGPVVDLVNSAKDVLRQLYDTMHAALRNPDLGLEGAIMRSKEHEIIGRITAISRQIHVMHMDVNSISGATISTLIQSFPKIVKLELRLNDLAKIISQINNADDLLRRYLVHGYKNMTVEETEVVGLSEAEREEPTYDMNDSKNNEVIMKKRRRRSWLLEQHTLEDFAFWATRHSGDSVLTLLGRIHDMVAPKERGQLSLGIFDLIKETSRDMQGAACNLPQSPHQLLYNLYNQVALAELKGYTITQFSYMLLKLYNKGNFTVESQLARDKFEERTVEEINAVREALEDADRTSHNCDPKQYVEGNNYVKLTKLLQGYIENEVNLNRYGTCRENCQYYYYTEYNGCFKDQFCSKQTQCHGKVVECKYIDSDMNICKSSDPDRRYDWIEYENGRVLGTKGTCVNRNNFKVDSWWRYLFWHCSYCFCLCDESHSSSDRYFNLRAVTADMENNKVVTGLRIIKKNQIIHLQIQEGPLGPRGVVNKSHIAWKNADDYKVHDHNVEDGVDYHTMSWRERALDLDTIMGPSDHIVTGVRFRKLGSHVNLEIQVTPFNFTTGELFKQGYSYWMGNDNTEVTENPRKEVILHTPDIPIRRRDNVIDSKPDQYVMFQATSMDTDAAQTTVPYLDAQPVTSQGFALAGVGLVHRGKPGSGGFVAPQLVTYDFARHLIAQFQTPATK